MAIPNMTANSPSLGMIAWDAFTIQYNGVGYAIPGGNTAERWVWWRYNGGGTNSALEAGAAVPQDLADDDLVLFRNKNGIPVRIQSSSLVDGDLLVDGSIVTKALAADAVTAEVVKAGTLTGDLFAGTLVMGTTITTGVVSDDGMEIVGARCEMGPNGFYTIDADNNPIAKFPLTTNEEAYVEAHFSLLSAEVKDNFTMRGTNNQVATSGELTLAAGVVSPSSPPTMESVYDTIQLDTNTVAPAGFPTKDRDLGSFSLNPSQITSMCWDNFNQCWAVLQQKSGGFRIWRFKTDGSIKLASGGQLWTEDYQGWMQGSLTFDPTANNGNGAIATLFEFGGQWYCFGFGRIGTIYPGWIVDGDGRPPVLGFDTVAGQFMIAQNNTGFGGTFFVRRFTLPSTDYATCISQSQYNAASGTGVNKRVNGVVYGPQVKSGQNRYAWSVDDQQTVRVADTAGVRKNTDGADEEWLKPNTGTGFCWSGTQFVSVDSAGVLTFFENWTWPETSALTYVGASAYDSDATGGTHETPVGTFSTFSQRKRAKLKITMPETNDSGLQDDPDKWKLYYSRKIGAAPTKADLKYVATIGSPTASTSQTITADPVGANPPGGINGAADSVNTFPAGNPASIESAALDTLNNPRIVLRGDGAVRFGDMSVDAITGKVDFARPPTLVADAWHIVGQAGQPAFINGWTNQNTAADPVRFKKTVSGTLILAGRPNGGSSTSDVVFMLPSGYYPSDYDLLGMIGWDNSAKAGCEARVGGTGSSGGVAPGEVKIMRGTTKSWYSFNGISVAIL